MGTVRPVLDVEAQSGKAHAAKHSLPRLCALLAGLAPEQRPAMVRGDIAFGNEGVMAEMEALGQSYLFKLRQSRRVQPPSRRGAQSALALLCGVAHLTQHAGPGRLLVTLTHAADDQIKAMIARIRKGLDHIRATAPQLAKLERWRALIRHCNVSQMTLHLSRHSLLRKRLPCLLDFAQDILAFRIPDVTLGVLVAVGQKLDDGVGHPIFRARIFGVVVDHQHVQIRKSRIGYDGLAPVRLPSPRPNRPVLLRLVSS
jgi:hypothetical protein